jgi:hypothetical protein
MLSNVLMCSGMFSWACGGGTRCRNGEGRGAVRPGARASGAGATSSGQVSHGPRQPSPGAPRRRPFAAAAFAAEALRSHERKAGTEDGWEREAGRCAGGVECERATREELCGVAKNFDIQHFPLQSARAHTPPASRPPAPRRRRANHPANPPALSAVARRPHRPHLAHFPPLIAKPLRRPAHSCQPRASLFPPVRHGKPPAERGHRPQ